ncbi:recombinase family protein [Vibrio parahaemolyticus]|uniref:recombinase family protein n=1 Tax=Vibrio parahaemolyticus TaxID=670 RepID=UPI00177DC60D|nr:recombinase family protein [Vibrio parahaemolyticus]MBD6969632.1 recombinase family protein [Vibrio parahaemolyticus]MBD6974479.1 recombinase family protein [Vibrio parahaemolyticus]
MKYGYVVQDNDVGMQIQAMHSVECEEIHQGDLSDVLGLLSSGDVLAVWRVDKLANTINGLEKALNEIHQAGATLELVFEQISSSRGNESQLSQLIGIMKQLER